MVSFVKHVLDPLTPGPNAPFGEHRVRFGDLAWATAAVSSRAFTRLYGGWAQESRPLLVPFLDMLNFNFEQENVQVGDWWGRAGALREAKRPGEALPAFIPFAALAGVLRM